MRHLVALALLAALATPALAAAEQLAPHHRYRRHPDQRLPYGPGAIPLFDDHRSSSYLVHTRPRDLDGWLAMWAWKMDRRDFDDQLDASADYFQ